MCDEWKRYLPTELFVSHKNTKRSYLFIHYYEGSINGKDIEIYFVLSLNDYMCRTWMIYFCNVIGLLHIIMITKDLFSHHTKKVTIQCRLIPTFSWSALPEIAYYKMVFQASLPWFSKQCLIIFHMFCWIIYVNMLIYSSLTSYEFPLYSITTYIKNISHCNIVVMEHLTYSNIHLSVFMQWNTHSRDVCSPVIPSPKATHPRKCT